MKTQGERTLRAFGVYFDLLDAADYLRRWMRAPLEGFDLTMQGFRLLVDVYRDGALPMTAAAKMLQCKRQNVNALLERLEERGLVRRERKRLAASEVRANKLAKAKREQARKGREFVVVRLTPEGESLLATVFPRHAKVVKALMRALDGREQETLGQLCRRVRAGDVMKFTSEITHADEWEEIEDEEEEVEEVNEVKEVKEVEEKSEELEVREAWAAREAAEARQMRDKPVQEAEEEAVGVAGGEIGADIRGEVGDRVANQIEEERRAAEARRKRQEAEVYEWQTKGQRRTPKPHKFARKRWRR